MLANTSDNEKSYLITISSEVDYIKNISSANHARLINSKLQINSLSESTTNLLDSTDFQQSIVESFNSRRENKYCIVYILIILQLCLLIMLFMYAI